MDQEPMQLLIEEWDRAFAAVLSRVGENIEAGRIALRLVEINRYPAPVAGELLTSLEPEKVAA